MGYFDDIRFVSAETMDVCRAVMDRRFEGSWSIEFMRSGRLELGMNHGPREIVEEPILFWHSPDHSYQYGAVDEAGWHHHWVMMQGPRAKKLVEEGFAPLGIKGYITVSQPDAIESLFHRLVDLVRSGYARTQPERIMLTEQILAIALSGTHSNNQPHHRHADVAAIAQAVSRAPLARHNFRELAGKLNLSYHRFRHVFRDQIGEAPHEFVMSCRLRKAAELLLDVRMQVQAVARECGYEDPGIFTRIFKKKIGLTPWQYRNTHISLRRNEPRNGTHSLKRPV